MNIDIVEKNRDLRRWHEPTGYDGFFWAAFSLLLMVSLAVFYRQAAAPDSQLALQGRLAAQIRLLDPAGIGKLTRIPLWSVSFAALYKLGVPFAWAAAIVCAAFMMLAFLLAQRVIRLSLGNERSAKLVTLAALAVVLAANVRVPFSASVALSAVRLPAIWQDPALSLGLAASLLCLFYAAHCLFVLREQSEGTGVQSETPPWRNAGKLSALLLLSALCHPGFVYAFLPAWAVYLAAVLFKRPKHWRFCLWMLLAALPAAAYAALASDGAVSLSAETVWLAVREALLAVAFPLFALLLVPRKETFRDPVIRLCLLLLAASLPEAALTARTEGGAVHGIAGAALLLWIVMLPRFIDQVFVCRSDKLRLAENARRGAVSAASLARAQRRLNLQSLGFLAGFILLFWQVYSGVYALYSLFVTGGGL